MRHVGWMERDERTPEQRRRDRLAHFVREEARLVRELGHLERDLAEARRRIEELTSTDGENR